MTSPRALAVSLLVLAAGVASGCATVNPVCLFNCSNGTTVEKKVAEAPASESNTPAAYLAPLPVRWPRYTTTTTECKPGECRSEAVNVPGTLDYYGVQP